VVQVNANHIFETYKGWSLQISTTALASGSTWPYVTVPQFEAQAQHVIRQSGATTVGFAPLVTTTERQEWESYVQQNRGEWIQEGFDFVNHTGFPLGLPFIFRAGGEFKPERAGDPLVDNYWAPLWQSAPVVETSMRANFDIFNFTSMPRVFERMVEADQPVLSEPINTYPLSGRPESFMATPIRDKAGPGGKLVAILIARLPWVDYFKNVVPEGIKGITVVVRNACTEDNSYRVDGPEVEFIDFVDSHETQYDNLEVSMEFEIFANVEQCKHTIHVYPTQEFEEYYQTKKPVVYTCAAVCIFLLTAIVFITYDCFVQRRQDTVMTSARRSSSIVSSLFPAGVRDRLMDNSLSQRNSNAQRQEEKPIAGMQHPGANLSSKALRGQFLKKKNNNRPLNFDDAPIADLFPNSTVLFADVAGFTAWSSVREPSQVFILLEGIYNAFDTIARRRKIFKVETIGDCYVAATGLPVPRKHHALAMARFAQECLVQMNQVAQDLEVRLGPDTAELSMRFGLHSGPVTAGVLRGEKSRFQLFGDTVNTAARMETTGTKNKIHLSEDTAALIVAAGKESWITARDKLVDVKGKGKMQTYWFVAGPTSIPSDGRLHTSSSMANLDCSETIEDTSSSLPPRPKAPKPKDPKLDRLIDWNVDLLGRLLKKVAAMRGELSLLRRRRTSNSAHSLTEGKEERTILDEVKEVITLPRIAAQYKKDPTFVTLSPEVQNQLQEFVSVIAHMYYQNHFHSFEHASHVTQSVSKLLSRVVSNNHMPVSTDYKELHDYTYGITSDPLTQFAVAFSALIHDVEHPGVPNAQLVDEKTDLATMYSGKSVAEQNSFDVAWSLLMEPCYSDLRAAIYATQQEHERFRQLVVNAVMATDIMDKELGALRRKRWEKAFNAQGNEDAGRIADRKATIVIEHLIQASDVAHTMQHWHVYIRWNERFFHECYHAYLEGRAEKDPIAGWYEGELGFFDFYILPLAKKLKDCKVFGVASDEYLNYALSNRKEWEAKGKDLVQRYFTSYKEASKPGSQQEFVEIR
jgi:class 3 adenylate cyclase